MRKVFAAAALAVSMIAGLSMITSSANAGQRTYVICWTGVGGYSECVNLPKYYRLPGIKKPSIPDGTVSFTLTRMIINCLKPYTDTSGMYPGQEATIYAPKRTPIM